jgi:two-component system chemotaxis sensor kinase CheA
VSASSARTANRQTLLALLFAPGFTTRESADLLAGRGVGLGLALQAVRRLGGIIRLASEQNMGLSATIRIPIQRGFLKVLWIDAGGVTYALPVRHVRRVVLIRSDDAACPVPLARYVAGLRAMEAFRSAQEVAGGSRPAALISAVELDPVRDGDSPPMATVDAVGSIEEVSLRPVTRIVTAAGPYLGAIVRGDDIRLCLDAHALAELAILAERT